MRLWAHMIKYMLLNILIHQGAQPQSSQTSPPQKAPKLSCAQMHQLEHNSYCQACNNYQFMKEKQQYSMAMQHSIQASVQLPVQYFC